MKRLALLLTTATLIGGCDGVLTSGPGGAAPDAGLESPEPDSGPLAIVPFSDGGIEPDASGPAAPDAKLAPDSGPTKPAASPPPIPAGAVLVTQHGAIPNDNQDDGAAVLAAAKAAGPGGVVGFPPGAYDLGGGPSWPGDRSYHGEKATLRGKGPKGPMVILTGDKIAVIGLAFEGGGIFFDKAGGFASFITVAWNRFKLNTSGEHRSAITMTCGLRDATITNNYFTGYQGGFGIYGYSYRRLTIANNEFVDLGAAMHIDAFVDSGDLLVEQNYISGVKGMGMEFQSTAENLVFQDNWFEHPNLSTVHDQNNNSMAYSLILDKSKNIAIRRNVVIAPERPDGTGCRIGFELGGDNSVAEHNYIDGINHVAAMNDGVGAASVSFRHNLMKNYLQGPSCSFCNSTRTWTAFDNGPQTQLPWSLARGKPGIGRRL